MCDFHSALGVALSDDTIELRHLPTNSHSEMAGDLENKPNRKPIIFEAEWSGNGDVPAPERLIRNHAECPPKLVETIVSHYQKLKEALADGKHLVVGGYFGDISKWSDVWSEALKRGVKVLVPDIAPGVAASTQKAGAASTQTAGYDSTQKAGDDSTQKAGDDSTQKAGYRSTQKAGDASTQTAGYRSTQKAGYRSTQKAGADSTQKAGIGSVQIVRWYDGEWKVKTRTITKELAEIWFKFENGDWRPCTPAEIEEAEKKTK